MLRHRRSGECPVLLGQIAAKMVSPIPVGPALEDRDARSFRVRADIASELGGFLLFVVVFIGCIMLKWSVFDAWTFQDSVIGYFRDESFPEEAKPNVNFHMMDVANSE